MAPRIPAVRFARNLLRTVWDPRRSDIRQGINTLIRRAARRAGPGPSRRLRARHPELGALFDEGYDPTLDLGRLEALPDGSLGREYARFVRASGIEPLGELVELRPDNLLEYTLCRAYKLHDLMHVVLGADASILGEVRIVGYSVGQVRSGAGRSLGGGGGAAELALAVLFLHLLLRHPRALPEARRLAREWVAVGGRARLHVSVRLEDLLERPVAEVRGALLGAAA